MIARATGVAPVGVPAPPAWLPPEAKTHYRREARKLADLGMATRLDGTVLAMHAASWWRMVTAERHLLEHGTVVVGASGVPVASPYVKVARDAFAECLRTAVELGLTPSARGRVKLPDHVPGAADSPIGRLMARRAQAPGPPAREWWDIDP